MLDKDRRQVLEEIEDWQRSRFKTGLAPALLDLIFYPVDRIVDFVIPDRVIEKALKPIMGTLRMLQGSSQVFVDREEVIKKVNDAGLSVERLEDFKDIPISYLDVLARSLFDKSTMFAALQGAGLGAGSYALMLIDLPVLFTVGLKTVLQIGACYGYEPRSAEEEEFALRIFCIASADGGERENEMGRMDELIVSFVKGVFSNELGILATEETIQGFMNKNVRRLVKKGLTRRLPLAGIALGSGFNYLFTKEMAIYGYMFYRKRFLKEALYKKGELAI
jgi:hypothetical protein